MGFAFLFLLLLLSAFCIEVSQGQLSVGFYANTCPDAESIVSSVVRNAARSSSNIPPVLLRLHFHDCFVEGCDGSILTENGPNAERHAFSHQGVGGFEVIEQAKAQLEATCPGVVSCADIVALAARDAIVLANGPLYDVPTGRRDGRVSDVSLAANMPDVSDSIQQLKDKFLQKGLSEKDLVLLSSAHTIGTTACFFMTKRLYNFSPGGGSDPAINPDFLPELKSICPQNGDVNLRLPMDRGSEGAFDKQILDNVRNGLAVLESDARLYDDDSTRMVVDSYFGFLNPIFGSSFEADFVESIVKMGQIGVKTGSNGEIRRVCTAFN
ncbi:Cationic peroxidase 2 [Hibiscus syriacus]|uniref:Peroxidase n=1 Tax=Hibiscus syriacus TaxID=106335 RepID=A0A6A3C9N8_HIBSY|nr:peroxidase 43-like [Hibiscus syriacus]KAE8725995.1 Cationic peroxidase 2 [Hibiscus syriacus]